MDISEGELPKEYSSQSKEKRVMITLELILIIVAIVFAIIFVISLTIGYLFLKDMDDSRKNEYWKHVNRE